MNGPELIQGHDGTWWKLGEATKDQLGHRGIIVEFSSRAHARIEWDENHMTTGEWISGLQKLPAMEGGYHD